MYNDSEYENATEPCGEDRSVSKAEVASAPAVTPPAAPPASSYFQTAPHFDHVPAESATSPDTPAATPTVPPVAPPSVPPVAPPSASAPPPRRETPPAPRRYVADSKRVKKASTPPAAKPPKKSSWGIWIAIIAVALVASMIGTIGGGVLTGVIMSGLSSPSSNSGTTNGSTTVQKGDRDDVEIEDIPTDTSQQLTPAQVYKKNVVSTVSVTAETTSSFLGYESTTASFGSGFIYSVNENTGYIVTNHHVIEGAKSFFITFYDGSMVTATLIDSDENNDIAVLRVEAPNLQPVTLGDSDKMNVGETVLAIGNPLGELSFSLTSGIVSALDRDIPMSSGLTMTLIQTDCPINSGNSGGALFNLHGEVIGITNAKYSSNSIFEASIDNIGFAIPLNSVTGIIDSIIQTGRYAKPYVGISVEDATEGVTGSKITSIEPGSAAAAAGLQVGDIITKVGEKAITNSGQLVGAISRFSVGSTVTFTVYRNNTYVDVAVTIGEKK